VPHATDKTRWVALRRTAGPPRGSGEPIRQPEEHPGAPRMAKVWRQLSRL
jgi:hypothetical protein